MTNDYCPPWIKKVCVCALMLLHTTTIFFMVRVFIYTGNKWRQKLALRRAQADKFWIKANQLMFFMTGVLLLH